MSLPTLNVYSDVRNDNWGYFQDGDVLPTLNTYSSPAFDEYGDSILVNTDPIPDLEPLLVDRGEMEYGDYSLVNDDPIPDLEPLFVDPGSPGESDPFFYAIMRARNTGAGAAYVYWLAEDGADLNGNYYNGSVPFSQLTDIIWAATVLL